MDGDDGHRARIDAAATDRRRRRDLSELLASETNLTNMFTAASATQLLVSITTIRGSRWAGPVAWTSDRIVALSTGTGAVAIAIDGIDTVSGTGPISTGLRRVGDQPGWSEILGEYREGGIAVTIGTRQDVITGRIDRLGIDAAWITPTAQQRPTERWVGVPFQSIVDVVTASTATSVSS